MGYTLILKEIRLQKKFTQKEVYEGICSDRHYIRIENNEVNPATDILMAIAKRLDVSIEELFIKE